MTTTQLPPSTHATQMTFPQAVEWIRPQLDIVDIVGKFVALKKAGRNFSGLCPFHAEKTPSFSVSREKQLFKCFGCGEGGDSLGFLMKVESKDFSQVIHDLAEHYGIHIMRDGQSQEAYAKQKAEQEVFYDLLALAAKYYREQLLETKSIQNYLGDRQISLPMQAQFGIGFAPPGWRHIEEAIIKYGQSVTPQQLETIGLLTAKDVLKSSADNSTIDNRYYDKFRNRLMIPIADDKGRVVAFGARAIEAEDSPKYLNSPETPLYIKHQILYGLNVAKNAIRDAGYAIVMEGYFDVISSHQAGFSQAVGVCGTALSKEHLTLLRRAGAKIIYLCFDTDNAGQAAAFKTLENLTDEALRQDLKFKVLQVPDGKDPDDYFKNTTSHTQNDFALILQDAMDPWEFQFNRVLTQIPNLQSIEGRVEAASALSNVLLRITQPVLKYEWVRQLSMRLHISENSFLEELKRQEVLKEKEVAAKKPASEASYVNNSQRKHGLLGNLSQQEAIYGLSNLYKNGSTKKNASRKNNTPPNPWPQAENLTHMRQRLAGKTGLHNKEAELLNYVFLSKETWDYMTASFDTLKFSTPLAEQLLGHMRAIQNGLNIASTGFSERLQSLKHRIDNDSENRQEMLQYLANRVFEAEKLAETFLDGATGAVTIETEGKTEKLFRVIDTVLASVKLSKESVVLNTMFERLRDAEASGEESQLALQAELKSMLEKKRCDAAKANIRRSD